MCEMIFTWITSRAVIGRLCLQAREAGQLLTQDVDSLSARLSGSTPSCLEYAQRLAKEVGVVSDVSSPRDVRLTSLNHHFY